MTKYAMSFPGVLTGGMAGRRLTRRPACDDIAAF